MSYRHKTLALLDIVNIWKLHEYSGMHMKENHRTLDDLYSVVYLTIWLLSVGSAMAAAIIIIMS